MRKIQLSFSQERFDQWRLSKAGGSIAFNKKGAPIFQFANQSQYDEYLRLNSERSKMA